MRIVVLCVFALAVLASAEVQAVRADDGGWTKIYDRPAGRVGAITMFDDQRGQAQIGGRVEETTDGGLTWALTDKTKIDVVYPGGEGWKASYAYNPYGYAPHGDSTLLHTVDSGATWEPVTVPGYGIFLGVWFLGTDGWVLATQCHPGDPTDPQATDPPRCVDHNTLLHTTDDGATWSALPDAGIDERDQVERIDAVVAYRSGRCGAGCYDTRLDRTDDAGQTWYPVLSRGPNVIRRFHFTSRLDGWVFIEELAPPIIPPPSLVPVGRLGHTRDGGATWTFSDVPTGVGGSFAVTSTRLVASTPSEAIAVYDINSGTWQDAVTDAVPALELMTFVTRERGYAVADSGDGHGTRTPWVTEDGGATWTAVATPRNLTVTTIGAGVWWARGERPLYRSADHGGSWQEVPLPPQADLKSGYYVQGSAGDRIWLVAGVWLWRSEDAGGTWRGIDIEPVPTYHIIDRDHAWTEACWPAECRHEIRLTSNGGDTWRTQAIPENVSVEGFGTPLDGWGSIADRSMVGRRIRMVTHDAGITWQTQPEPRPPVGNQFFSAIPLDVYRAFGVTVDRGAPHLSHIWETQDGGADWADELDVDTALSLPLTPAIIAHGRIWLTFTHIEAVSDVGGSVDRVVIYRKDLTPAPVETAANAQDPADSKPVLVGMLAALAAGIVVVAGFALVRKLR